MTNVMVNFMANIVVTWIMAGAVQRCERQQMSERGSDDAKRPQAKASRLRRAREHKRNHEDRNANWRLRHGTLPAPSPIARVPRLARSQMTPGETESSHLPPDCARRKSDRRYRLFSQRVMPAEHVAADAGRYEFMPPA
jgi:hypothetical protein